MSLDFTKEGFFENMMKIPCMRKSLLYGLSGGLGAGLLRFVLTSNARKAANFGFGSYLGITTLTWAYCQYTRSRINEVNTLLANGIEQFIINEGTSAQKDEAIKSQLKDA